MSELIDLIAIEINKVISDMKRHLPIYLYGLIIIIAGIVLLFAKNSTFTLVKYSVGITLIAGAIFAFITAFSRQRTQVQFAYHEMHALAMLVYGIAIILFCHSLERLVSFTAFLFIFYSFSEIIFCIWLFNLSQKVVYKIVAIRTLLGLAIGIGTIVAINDPAITLQLFSLLFIMVGINVILYVPVMQHTVPIDMPKKNQQ